MGGNDDVSAGALEDVAYLTRSNTRVAVLGALVDGPYTMRDLREAVGASRSTVSRTVSEFEDRNWVTRTEDGEYTATVQGRHVVTQLDPFLASMAVIRDLGDALEAVPPDELEVGPGDDPLGLRAFADATVYRSSRMEPDKVFEPWIRRLQSSETLRILGGAGLTEQGNAVIHEEVVSGRLETTAVCSAPLVDQMLNPEQGHATPAQIQARHEAGGRLYRYPGDVPCNVSLFDEGVIVSSQPAAVALETENDTARAWAEATFQRYLEASTLVEPDRMGGT